MPVTTWSVPANADDVSQLVGVTNPGGAGDYITGTYLNARAHQSQVGVAALQFTVSIPKGATINSVRLSWVAVPPDGISQDASEMLVAVENSLSPAAFGTASPNRPSDRLTNRTSDGSATYYNVTWQDAGGTAVANPAAIPNSTRVYTQDFSDLLQPLVDNASWSSVDQKITIFCWGYDTNPSSLSTSPGSSTYRNSAARWASAGTATPPQITVDYAVIGPTYTLNSLLGGSVSGGDSALVNREGPILLSEAGGSRSGGRGALRVGGAPNPVVVVRNQRYDNTLPLGWIIPGLNGDGDTVMDDAECGNPMADVGLENPAGPRIKVVSQPLAPSGYSIRIESWANRAANARWRFNAHSGEHRTHYTSPLSVYSARFYYRHEVDGGNYGLPDAFPGVMRFLVAGQDMSWGIQLDDRTGFPLTDTESERLRIVQGNGTVNGQLIAGPASERLLGTAGRMWRYEVQVDAARNPKVRVRVYLNDETEPFSSLTANPTSVLADQILIGVTASNQFFSEQHWADIEIHSNYTLSGEFQDPATSTGAPYVPKTWQWFEYVGAEEIEELDDLGTWTGTEVDGYPLTYEDDYREVAGPSRDTSPFILYAPGRNLVVHRPAGVDPPEGGWPVVLLVHGGFFVEGGLGDWTAQDQILQQILSLGWAAVCVNYTLSTPFASTSYPAYDAGSDTGRYPSHIVDIKRAAHAVQTNTSIYQTYGLDPNRLVVAGFSAGGYIALAAHASRDVTADALGRDLTIYGSDPWAGVSALQDPAFLGAYAWSGPVSMQAAVDGDEAEFPTLTGNTPIVSGAKAFMGKGQQQAYSLLGTGVDEILAVQPNPELLGPIGYNGGSSDYLVKPWDQIPLLEAACADAGVPFDSYVSYNTSHDNMKIEFDPDHLIRFLEQFGVYRLTDTDLEPTPDPYLYADSYSDRYSAEQPGTSMSDTYSDLYTTN